MHIDDNFLEALLWMAVSVGVKSTWSVWPLPVFNTVPEAGV